MESLKPVIELIVLFIITSLTTVDLRFIHNTQCSKFTLDPCRSEPTHPSRIFCENIEDIRTFIRVIRCGSKKNMNEMFLEDSSIESIPLIVMDFCGVNHLSMRNVTLSTLFDDARGNLIRLESLHLDDVTSTDPLSWNALVPLNNLKRFSVAHMQVPSVDNALVDHLSSDLQSISLTSTNTSLIGDLAFTKFTDLVFVSIEDNMVSRVRRSMFATPAKIKYFHFGKNRITWLPDDLFENMPYIRSVSFVDNMIAEIHEVTFRGIWHTATSVLMEGNPLKCHCKMLWLAKKGTPTDLSGECFSPKSTYGKPLKNLSIDDFQC